ncbi:MAG TPA: class I SAM-dependent methyltransferase [Pilimelia sp.]|nr:class I SAM-dependent methyltransferase [Pilimelia sp.]
MDAEVRGLIDESGYGEPGFAERYDRYRPQPPAALLELLPPLAGVQRPHLVIDLGSGTGLSTRIWAGHAGQVIGVEPNDAMRTFAQRATDAANVRYVGASAYQTGLPDGCADLVTAAQSLQWMRPERVLPEIRRILRPGGVFCAYAYVALQTSRWEPEAEWDTVLARKRDLRARLGLDREEQYQPVSRAWIEQSGLFRYVRELALHSVEVGSGDRLVGLALSEGSMTTLLAAGATEEEVGLDRLRLVAATMPDPVPWWISYRAWVALA